MVPLFIRLMTLNGAIWSRDQRTVIMRRVSSLQGVIKRSLKDNTFSTTVCWFMVPA